MRSQENERRRAYVQCLLRPVRSLRVEEGKVGGNVRCREREGRIGRTWGRRMPTQTSVVQDVDVNVSFSWRPPCKSLRRVRADGSGSSRDSGWNARGVRIQRAWHWQTQRRRDCGDKLECRGMTLTVPGFGNGMYGMCESATTQGEGQLRIPSVERGYG